MAELMEGLMQQAKGGGGMGGGGPSGMGMGGSSDSGYSTSGISMNLPAIGPDRMRFNRPPGAVDGQGGRGRGGEDSADIGSIDERSEVGSTGERSSEDGELSINSVPEKYRDAVRKYFSQPDPVHNP